MFCDSCNMSIYYETHGDGIPVLMIHGFCPDHRLMKGCMEPIFARRPGWQRIYFDLPGMGRTRGEPWIDCSDRVLEVVFAFVDRLLLNQSFLVVGILRRIFGKGTGFQETGIRRWSAANLPLIIPGSKSPCEEDNCRGSKVDV